MPKITFMGAGSTIFAKNVLGDCMCAEPLHGATIALYDIDKSRLEDSARMLEFLNETLRARMRIERYLGPRQRKAALRDADWVVNAVQIGGYKPATVTDFEVPKKYGLRQTIGDTLGIGGIFRALRTIPVLLQFAREMECVCPDAWFLNYANPVAMLVMGLTRGSNIRTVGLCHSVEGAAPRLLKYAGIKARNLQYKVAGVNHQSWVLEVSDRGRDLYPRIKRALRRAEQNGTLPERDLVRLELLKRFGYFVTESSFHSAEYYPWFIKARYPRLLKQYNIGLDEYPKRCVNQIKRWAQMRKDLVKTGISHKRSHEYASHMMEAMLTDVPFKFGGNVPNTDLVTNLPRRAIVEVHCIADRSGISPCYVGDLPEPCAALNRLSVNVQILTVEAALTRKKDYLYQAALLDPHTGGELSVDDTVRLCDDLLKAHGTLIPKMR